MLHDRGLIVEVLPVLEDNYVFIIYRAGSTEAVVVDPAVSEPMLKFLKEHQLNLRSILLTHHHGDHVGGVAGLRKVFTNCQVIGSTYDQARLPPLDHVVKEGDAVEVLGERFFVWHVPGHTSGHIVFMGEDVPLAFVGDLIFGMGCGRVFEGSMAEMYQSLSRFRNLKGAFKLYCAHEYTRKNAEFADSLKLNLKEVTQRVQRLREENPLKKTVPLCLGEELRTNPFLLASTLGEFTELRVKRNSM